MREDKDFAEKDGALKDRKMGARKVGFKKKVCKFCQGAAPADYKNPDMLRRYITERGKILPARITGTFSHIFLSRRSDLWLMGREERS